MCEPRLLVVVGHVNNLKLTWPPIECPTSPTPAAQSTRRNTGSADALLDMLRTQSIVLRPSAYQGDHLSPPTGGRPGRQSVQRGSCVVSLHPTSQENGAAMMNP